MVVVHRIQWWRLRSATHLWTRRWLRSPSPQSLEQWGHKKSIVVITAEAALRCLSLAAVSFWHRLSSKLAVALWTEPRHFGLSMAYSSKFLGLMWHHWILALTVSLYRSFGLPWFLLDTSIHTYINTPRWDTSPAFAGPSGIRVGLGIKQWQIRVGELQPLSPMYSTRPCCLV